MAEPVTVEIDGTRYAARESTAANCCGGHTAGGLLLAVNFKLPA